MCGIGEVGFRLKHSENSGAGGNIITAGKTIEQLW
jgi:hypothetical protein